MERGRTCVCCALPKLPDCVKKGIRGRNYACCRCPFPRADLCVRVALSRTYAHVPACARVQGVLESLGRFALPTRVVPFLAYTRVLPYRQYCCRISHACVQRTVIPCLVALGSEKILAPSPQKPCPALFRIMFLSLPFILRNCTFTPEPTCSANLPYPPSLNVPIPSFFLHRTRDSHLPRNLTLLSRSLVSLPFFLPP